jgi:hypothetical protein
MGHAMKITTLLTTKKNGHEMYHSGNVFVQEESTDYWVQAACLSLGFFWCSTSQ